MPAIIQYSSSGTDQRFLCGTLISIGRSKKNDIVVSDPQVSRSHSMVRRLGENKYYLIDLGSANGTYINDKRVIVPTLLKHEDMIKVGAMTLEFRLEEGKSATTDLKDTEDLRATFAVEALSISEITVLVADIRAYTFISEHVPINLLAKLVGQWFRSANDVIEKNSGMVDKFIGDAVMACWLMSKENPGNSIRSTLTAAYELHTMTDEMNLIYPQLPLPLRIGVGISTGEAMFGDMGSGRLQDYTVLGDSVNTAFHLETASKELNTDVIISYNSVRRFPHSFWGKCQTSVRVKGKDEPLEVFQLKFSELAEVLR